MKSFIDMFTSARAISTPLVTVRTFDPSSTIQLFIFKNSNRRIILWKNKKQQLAANPT
jgi:hypothetical protein